MNKELEEAVKHTKYILNIYRNSKTKEYNMHADLLRDDLKAIEIIVQALENSIPKQIIEKQLEYDKGNYIDCIGTNNNVQAVQNYIRYLEEKILEGK